MLIVDDIIDTGRTLQELSALVAAEGPRGVATVAFVSKTSRRLPDAEPDYKGLEAALSIGLATALLPTGGHVQTFMASAESVGLVRPFLAASARLPPIAPAPVRRKR